MGEFWREVVFGLLCSKRSVGQVGCDFSFACAPAGGPALGKGFQKSEHFIRHFRWEVITPKC